VQQIAGVSLCICQPRRPTSNCSIKVVDTAA